VNVLPKRVRTVDLFLAVWAAVSVVFWGWCSFVTGAINPFVLYYPLWLGGAGTLMWRYRVVIQWRLRSWDAAPAVKFLLLGFGTVLTEGVVAAFANTVPEGFSPLIFLVRIVQFWDLNIFTFCGFIGGWCLLHRYVVFTRREVFYLAGLWGLYAEKVLFTIPSNPLFFVFAFAPTILTYGLIIMPALLSQDTPAGRKRLRPVLRYPLCYGVIFVCSVPAILMLWVVRDAVPTLFPPASLVPF
jgi:hypothetical protein